jgi:hypothetical protein
LEAIESRSKVLLLPQICSPSISPVEEEDTAKEEQLCCNKSLSSASSPASNRPVADLQKKHEIIETELMQV